MNYTNSPVTWHLPTAMQGSARLDFSGSVDSAHDVLLFALTDGTNTSSLPIMVRYVAPEIESLREIHGALGAITLIILVAGLVAAGISIYCAWRRRSDEPVP